MQHDMAGPLWGNIVVLTIGGAITVACFAAMVWMLFRPGERDPRHVKNEILREDR
jgi:hypothetical protein